MIRPMHVNEAIEMSDFDNITDASRRFAATYNDSLILKLRIWWWNLTRKQRRLYVTSLLIFAILLIFIFVTVPVQHKPVAVNQTSTTTYTTAVTSYSVTSPTSMSTITTNTSSIDTSTMNATVTTPTASMISITLTNTSTTPIQTSILKKKHPSIMM